LAEEYDAEDRRPYGMNWKMTAKTALVQMNHKIMTLESLSKHLVLVIQDHLLSYMRREFQFDHIENARLGDSAHFHIYSLEKRTDNTFHLNMQSRLSTDADGIVECLGLMANPNIELSQLITSLESKIGGETLLQIS